MSQIFFKRPKYIPSGIFRLLGKAGFQAVDLHFHTEYGMDSVSRITETLRKCQQKGIGVAITDHNEVRGAEKAWRLRKSVFVIPGIEVSAMRGVHSLYFFSRIGDCRSFFSDVVRPLRKKNPFFLPIALEELMEKTRDYNAFISVPQPYGPGVIGIKKVRFPKLRMRRLERHFDLVEALNAANLRRMNERALRWARFIRKPMTAGSDGHTTAELGKALTLAYGSDIESYFASLKKGLSILMGKEQNIVIDAFHELVKQKKYFREARAMGKGLFWVKEHTREFERLGEKLRRLERKAKHPGSLFHSTEAQRQRHLRHYKEYLKLGGSMFRGKVME